MFVRSRPGGGVTRVVVLPRSSFVASRFSLTPLSSCSGGSNKLLSPVLSENGTMTERREMIPGFLLTLLSVVALFSLANAGGHGGHNHVVIHVPYKVKTIHHTHTITKHIHHGGGGGDKYEVLGYTVGHPIDLGGHGGGGGGGGFGGGGHDFGGGGHDFGGGGHDFGGGGGGGGGGGHLELSGHDGGFGGDGGGGGFGGGGWTGH